MSSDLRVTIGIPPSLEAVLRAVARRNGRSFEEEILSALRRGVRPAIGPAKTSRRTDEQLLAPIRALLAGDIARATGWQDLQARLQRHGYVFRERGGGLALYRIEGGDRICKASELGASYANLVRRFGAPFPGHAHAHVAVRIGAQRRHLPPPSPAPRTEPEDHDDPILIEDD